MTVQIQLRRGTAADWTSNGTVILAAGEPGFETDTGKFKVGDGTTTWNSLPYAGGLESLRLQDLSNVTSTSPTNGQVLKWNGTAWAPAADSTGGGGGVTYAISSETATGGANLRLTGSDASTDDVKLAGGTNVTVTRTDANTITIAASGSSTTLGTLTDVDLTTPPTNGQVLKYDTGTSKWVAGTDNTGGGGGGVTYSISSETATGGVNLRLTGSDASTDNVKFAEGSNVTITRTDANTITIAAAGGGGGGGLSTRTTGSATATLLADGASANINITSAAKTYALLKIETNVAAWVRIYTDDASRTADSSRAEGVDPTPGSGVIAEVITTGAQTILMSPAAIGFNNETSPVATIPLRVTNKAGISSDVTATVTYLQLEA